MAVVCFPVSQPVSQYALAFCTITALTNVGSRERMNTHTHSYTHINKKKRAFPVDFVGRETTAVNVKL